MSRLPSAEKAIALTSDNAEVGIKAVISSQSKEGMVYIKYKKLDAILKMNNGDRNIDILKARKKYDEYSIKKSSIPVQSVASPDAETNQK